MMVCDSSFKLAAVACSSLGEVAAAGGIALVVLGAITALGRLGDRYLPDLDPPSEGDGGSDGRERMEVEQ